MSQLEVSTTPRLSDDEVVALSIDQGVLSAVVPTVDVSRSDELLRAAARGWRSLTIRGLFDPEGGGPVPMLRNLQTGLTKSPTVRTYIAGEGINAVADGVTNTFAALGAGRVLLDLVTPAGIHAFDFCSSEEGLIGVTAAALEVAQHGALQVDANLALCVTCFDVDGRHEVGRISPSETRRFIIENDGSITDRGPVSLDLWLKSVCVKAFGVTAEQEARP